MALANLHQPLLFEHPQRFAQGVAADVQQALKFPLGGQAVPDRKAALHDGAFHLLDDALECPNLPDFGEHKD